MENLIHAIPPWLLCVLGMGLAVYGDTRGLTTLTAIGFVVLVPAFAWFAYRVCSIIFSRRS